MREHYTIKQAATAIGVSAQIMRGWLAETAITTATGKDKRARYLTRAQVVTLANAHNRAITDDPGLAGLVGEMQALRNALEALSARLAALEQWKEQEGHRYSPMPRKATPAPLESQPELFSVPSAPSRLAALGKIDAARLMAGRHGVAFNTAKGWPWPASALASEHEAIRWALDYVRGRKPHLRPDGWRWRCDTPSCPCQGLAE